MAYTKMVSKCETDVISINENNRGKLLHIAFENR